MRKFLATLMVGTLGLVNLANAQQSVVVVELYTSQGCSSCPAADEILAEVSDHDNVIALGLHVDYWDYLGWKDKLARPEFTERQARFNTIMKSRYRLVTPQMIFNGTDYVAGAKRSEALKYIKMSGDAPERAKLALKRDGNVVRISVTAVGGQSAPSDVHIVRFTPAVDVAIKRGENAGRKITYVNTVTEWNTVGKWDGKQALEFDHTFKGDGELAIIVQKENFGPVLVARRLNQ